MRLVVLSAFCCCWLAACAQPELREGDVFTLMGQRHAVSDSDLEMALDVVRNDMSKRYGSQLPITRVRVIDHDHIRAGYWHRMAIHADLERVGGHWKITRHKTGDA